MKLFITFMLLLSFSQVTLAAKKYSASEMAQLRADKAHVLKQEIKKIKRMMGKSSLVKSSMKAYGDCDEDDIDIDIDIDINDDSTSGGVSPYCERRWSDGTCMTYGSDQAGTCYPSCERRWSDGSCMTWGADVCN